VELLPAVGPPSGTVLGALSWEQLQREITGRNWDEPLSNLDLRWNLPEPPRAGSISADPAANSDPWTSAGILWAGVPGVPVSAASESDASTTDPSRSRTDPSDLSANLAPNVAMLSATASTAAFFVKGRSRYPAPSSSALTASEPLIVPGIRGRLLDIAARPFSLPSLRASDSVVHCSCPESLTAFQLWDTMEFLRGLSPIFSTSLITR
jgi:hypothetical protein